MLKHCDFERKMEPRNHLKNRASMKSLMRKGNLLFPIWIMFSLIANSCSGKKEFNRDDLIGTWDVQYNNEQGNEVIRDYYGGSTAKYKGWVISFDYDGTFTQHFSAKRYGKWQIEGSGENRRLVLIFQNGEIIEHELKYFQKVSDNYKKGYLNLKDLNGKIVNIPIYTN